MMGESNDFHIILPKKSSRPIIWDTRVSTFRSKTLRMETSLHRELKRLLSGNEADEEQTLAGYRIDAVVNGRLIEVQVASLFAIRRKIVDLLEQGFEVTVVKPLTSRKQIIRREKKGGAEISRRWSPRRQKFPDVFSEMVHFVGAFPHPRLTLELMLITEEEFRINRATRWKRQRDFKIEDRRLVSVEDRRAIRSAEDLLELFPKAVRQLCVESPFTTADLAKAAEVPRWLAQKIAYCFRKLNVWETTGKRERAWLYQPVAPKPATKLRAPRPLRKRTA